MAHSYIWCIKVCRNYWKCY